MTTSLDLVQLLIIDRFTYIIIIFFIWKHRRLLLLLFLSTLLPRLLPNWSLGLRICSFSCIFRYAQYALRRYLAYDPWKRVLLVTILSVAYIAVFLRVLLVCILFEHLLESATLRSSSWKLRDFVLSVRFRTLVQVSDSKYFTFRCGPCGDLLALWSCCIEIVEKVQVFGARLHNRVRIIVRCSLMYRIESKLLVKRLRTILLDLQLR